MHSEVSQSNETENSSADIQLQFAKMTEFEQSFRSLESHYAKLYSQVQAIEKEITHHKNFF